MVIICRKCKWNFPISYFQPCSMSQKVTSLRFLRRETATSLGQLGIQLDPVFPKPWIRLEQKNAYGLDYTDPGENEILGKSLKRCMAVKCELVSSVVSSEM